MTITSPQLVKYFILGSYSKLERGFSTTQSSMPGLWLKPEEEETLYILVSSVLLLILFHYISIYLSIFLLINRTLFKTYCAKIHYR